MSDEHVASPARGLAAFRLVAGLAQGLALYLLYSAFDAKSWPATDGYVFGPLALLAFFLPLIVIQGAGNLRTATLVAWTAAAAAIIAGLAWYDVWRAWPIDYVWDRGSYVAGPHVLPSGELCFYLAVGLFIAHALISGADADRRFAATYPTHFDTAWKLGIQIALSIAFVCAFWLILWLGAGLFKLIKLDFFETLIEHRWFAIPATALATAASLHVTDVRAGLVRGTRTLALVLLSWLLPLMALIAAGFLGSLVFTGLAPLWATRHASALLLTATAVLVILINAAYQDGHAERKASLFFALAIRLASVLLVPTVALAAYAVWLRVAQYGWTVERIESAAIVLVAASYALGYALGAILPGLRLVERWNFVTALLVLAVLGALFTPLADPARISVDSQMARLRDHRTSAKDFDVNYMRAQGGVYGHAALEDLAKDKDAGLRDAAKTELAATGPYGYTPRPVKATVASLAENITVYPKGAVLPSSLLKQDWSKSVPVAPQGGYVPGCLQFVRNPCDAFPIDLDGDGHDEVLILVEASYGGTGTVLRQGADGIWSLAGNVVMPMCDSGLAALKAGRFRLAAHPYRDIVIGDTTWQTTAFTPEQNCRR